MSPLVHPASYRDPSGFIFRHRGVIYRQVNKIFKEDFNLFIESGLYEHLVREGLLISHTIIESNLTGDKDWYMTIKPEQLSVITYPYEWCFNLLKDAALLTLTLAQKAMQYGMILKDASPFNIQFHQGRTVFIDTLSFGKLDATKPWIAYRQFCETFLAPLALMHFLKRPLQPLLLAYPDGIPLSIVKKMLPVESRFHIGTYLHLHLNASVSNSAKVTREYNYKFSEKGHQRILHSLKNCVASFHLRQKTVWSDYYKEAAQREDYLAEKKGILVDWLTKIPNIARAIDVGANAGLFAEPLAERGIRTIAADSDHFVIDSLYKKVKENQIANLIPVLFNMAQPNPAIGVNNEERNSSMERFHSDLLLALALIHHLSIGRNIPFTLIADCFSRLGNYLIIEFVPKEDAKVKEMLSQKQDIYKWYSQIEFEQSFQEYFDILSQQEIKLSGRTLYLMKKHEP